MKKLVFLVLIFFTVNLVCMQELKIKITNAEVFSFMKQIDYECVVCGGNSCDNAYKGAKAELKLLKQKKENGKKD